MNETNHSNHPLIPQGISGHGGKTDSPILPKTVNISFGGKTLKVRNHQIITDSPTPTGLVDFVTELFRQPGYRGVLSEMTSQGLDMETVKKHCIYELKSDPEVFARLVAFCYGVLPRNHTRCLEFSRHPAGRLLVSYHITALERCDDWSDIAGIFSMDGDFYWWIYSLLRDTMYRECIHRLIVENPDVNPAINIDFFRRLVATEFALPDYTEIDPLIRQIASARMVQN